MVDQPLRVRMLREPGRVEERQRLQRRQLAAFRPVLRLHSRANVVPIRSQRQLPQRRQLREKREQVLLRGQLRRENDERRQIGAILSPVTVPA